MNFSLPPFSIGSVIAIIVLVLAIVLMIVEVPSPLVFLGLIAALAVARLT